MELRIRDWEPADVERIVAYFVDGELDFLDRMGVDPTKLPDRSAWHGALLAELALPLDERERHYVIWEVAGRDIGHSNVSDLVFGQHAHMHLHMWEADVRRKGIGTELVRASIDRFFELFHLDTLFSEPYALNPAPNHTLPKVGFEFVEEYHGVPGPISFPQPVSRWKLSRERWEAERHRT